MVQKRPDRTLGPGHDEFWAWCARGELRLQRCGDCGGLSWPVVSACEHCDSTKLTWERMSGRGKLVSWCSFDHDYYRGMLPVPYDTILVELAEGPLFISNPSGFGREDIRLRNAGGADVPRLRGHGRCLQVAGFREGLTTLRTLGRRQHVFGGDIAPDERRADAGAGTSIGAAHDRSS